MVCLLSVNFPNLFCNMRTSAERNRTVVCVLEAEGRKGSHNHVARVHIGLPFILMTWQALKQKQRFNPHRHTHTNSVRQRDRQTNRQRERETDKQTDSKRFQFERFIKVHHLISDATGG